MNNTIIGWWCQWIMTLFGVYNAYNIFNMGHRIPASVFLEEISSTITLEYGTHCLQCCAVFLFSPTRSLGEEIF